MSDYDIDIARLAGQGFCCTQIVLQLALAMQGSENKALIRTMAGLCHGFPDTKGPCGALTGAACMLGLYAGKGSDDEDENERLELMLSSLHEWFSAFCGQEMPNTRGIACSDIVPDGQVHPAVCGKLIGACFEKALTLLMENGFDLTAGDT